MGKLATAAQNAAVAKEAPSPLARLKQMLNTEDCRKRLNDTMAENAGAFSASIIELFNSDKYLAQCDPAQVLAECFKAASLKLPMNKQLGFAYVIPYFDSKAHKYAPQFQLGYKGYIQLAQRSGAYKYINCDVVFEGEFVSRDKLTGEIDLSGERVSDKAVGYFAHFELLNGFRKTLYMSADEVLDHAKKRSKTYRDGKFSGPWATDFDAMAMKTCVRLLISKYGIMSVDTQKAIVAEYPADEIGTMADSDYADVPDVPENEVVVDEQTGEVIESA